MAGELPAGLFGAHGKNDSAVESLFFFGNSRQVGVTLTKLDDRGFFARGGGRRHFHFSAIMTERQKTKTDVPIKKVGPLVVAGVIAANIFSDHCLFVCCSGTSFFMKET